MANGTITINEETLRQDGLNVLNAVCELIDNEITKCMFKKASEVFLKELCAYEFGREK